jgi:hypothetical protein
VTFRHLDLEAAERELVGACIRHVWALERCAERFPDGGVRCLRSRPELRAIVGVLAVLYERGDYADPEANEQRLAVILAGASQDRSPEAWLDYLDELYTPWVANPEYVDGLLDAILGAYRLQDEAVEATDRYLHQNPLAVDQGLQDAVFLRMREAIIRAREQRFAKPAETKVASKGTTGVFKR